MSETASETPLAPQPILDLEPGELVRVRSASEIFAMLDERGRYDGLPFMPEMLKYCGLTLPVTARADTTCAGTGAVRRMENAVHLQKIRCDGSFHDGCQAACLTFWKEAWLERVEKGAPSQARPLNETEDAYVAETLIPATKDDPSDDGVERYRCQATDVPKATVELRFRELDQYKRDLRNWKLPKIVRGVAIEVFNLYQMWSKRHVPKWMRIQRGAAYPFVVGKLEKGKTPPSAKLDLQPGDLVRIKPKAEIVATLDTTNHNRGLSFDGEMANYCGRTARVRTRVSKIIEERNGEMITIKSDCIILDGVVCTADYHRFCTRAIFPYWREIWLEKIESPGDMKPDAPCVDRWSKA